MKSPDMGNTDLELLKAILGAVDREEQSDDDYRASTKYLIERISGYDIEEVGGAIERLVDNEQLLKGRDYSPREGETFKFYIHLTLTLRGKERLIELTEPTKPIQIDLFD